MHKCWCAPSRWICLRYFDLRQDLVFINQAINQAIDQPINQSMFPVFRTHQGHIHFSVWHAQALLWCVYVALCHSSTQPWMAAVLHGWLKAVLCTVYICRSHLITVVLLAFLMQQQLLSTTSELVAVGMLPCATTANSWMLHSSWSQDAHCVYPQGGSSQWLMTWSSASLFCPKDKTMTQILSHDKSSIHRQSNDQYFCS